MSKPRTPEEKKAIIDGYEGSNMSVEEYCKTKKVSASQFYGWRKTYSLKTKSKIKQLPKSRVSSEAKVEVLKEMLADQIHESRKNKIAA